MTSKQSLAEKALLRSLPQSIQANAKPQYNFCHGRGWAFDLAWPAQRIAVEVDGQGYHHSTKGHRLDCEKLNVAAAMGWRVLRYPANSIGAITKTDGLPVFRANRVRLPLIVEQITAVICDTPDIAWGSIGVLAD
jgi:very-short-patch-repair endonuclease